MVGYAAKVPFCYWRADVLRLYCEHGFKAHPGAPAGQLWTTCRGHCLRPTMRWLSRGAMRSAVQPCWHLACWPSWSMQAQASRAWSRLTAGLLWQREASSSAAAQRQKRAATTIQSCNAPSCGLQVRSARGNHADSTVTCTKTQTVSASPEAPMLIRPCRCCTRCQRQAGACQTVPGRPELTSSAAGRPLHNVPHRLRQRAGPVVHLALPRARDSCRAPGQAPGQRHL